MSVAHACVHRLAAEWCMMQVADMCWLLQGSMVLKLEDFEGIPVVIVNRTVDVVPMHEGDHLVLDSLSCPTSHMDVWTQQPVSCQLVFRLL